MDSADSNPSSEFSPSGKWSAYVGVYTLLCSTILLQLLSPVSNTLVKILGLPTSFSAVLLAGPAAIVGAIVWWALVERRGAYTYRYGVVFGLLTTLVTVLLWILAFAVIWGLGTVLTGLVLIGFVTAVTVPVALGTGLTSMYARRHLNERASNGTHTAG